VDEDIRTKRDRNLRHSADNKIDAVTHRSQESGQFLRMNGIA
jgi:hypothetical protein